MRARLIAIAAGASTFALPILVVAQTQQTGLLGTLALFNRILNGAIGLVVLLAILAFFWGLVQYFFKSKGSDEDRKAATKLMIYGILAIFVMVSIWGLIRLLQTTFGVTQNTSITPAGIVSF